MNDFTKEELEDIKYAICHLISEGSFDSQWNKDIKILKEKIQSMIENYCEHEPHGDFHVCVDKCKKCGVIINE